MRITCPNCTAHFEIPSELLGRKGRSLKCASCGHSWYQTPQVETIDLAEIMGEEYAAKAKADMGVGKPSSAPAPGQNLQQRPPQGPQNPQQRPLGMAQPPSGVQAAALPGGAVSLMGKPPPPPPPGGWQTAPQMQRPGAPPPNAPAWYQPTPVSGPGGPGGQQAAAPWYTPQAAPGQGGPGGQQAANWYQQQPPPGAAGPGGQAPAWYNNPQNAPGGAQGAPGGANWYQGQPQAGPGGAPPGSAASWYNQQAPGGGPGYPQQQPGVQAAALGGRPVGAGGGPAQVGAAALGNSMMGGPGAQIPGQGAVSWMQQPGQNVGQPPPGANMGVMHMQRPQGPTAAQMGNQSMMGQAGAGAVGDASVSWMGPNGQQQMPGGVPGQSMQFQGPNGPGGMAVSQMTGAQVGAPGMGATSMIDGSVVQAPGVPGQSMVGNMPQGPGLGAMSQLSGQQIAAPGQGAVSQLSGQQIAAPGQGAVSQLSGDQIAAPGAAAVSQLSGDQVAPGDPARSMLDGSMQQGQAGQSMMQAPGAGGQPGQSMMHDAGAGGAAAQSTLGPNAANPTAQQQAGGIVGPDGKLVTDPTKAKADATLVPGEAGAEGEEKPSLFTSAKEDEELVDPNADRPDFGSTEEAAAAEEDGADEGEDEDEEEAAAATKPPPFKPSKSIDPAYITAGLMIFATLACGSVVYSQRAALMKMWPGFAALYEKTGMAPKNPGEGLRLAQSGMRLQRIGGVETLVVKGYISNIGQTARDVPNLRLQLIDATNVVVQEVKSPAPKASLDPGGSVDYEMRLELPDMAKAKNVVVAWDAG